MTNYRGDSQSIGKMRYRITIQSPTVTLDDITGQEKRTWDNFMLDIPAAKRSPRGGELNFAGVTEVVETIIFRIRYIAGLNERMRILFNSVYYGITLIQDVRDGDRFLDVWCKVVK